MKQVVNRLLKKINNGQRKIEYSSQEIKVKQKLLFKKVISSYIPTVRWKPEL